MPGKAEQIFTFETVAVILCCMLESGVTLGTKHYKMMSAIDGNRGEAAFQHQFRRVKARAKELHEQADNGENGTPVKKGKGKDSKTATPTSGKKRGRKPATETPSEDEKGVVKPDLDESPTKKIKEEFEADDGDLLN